MEGSYHGKDRPEVLPLTKVVEGTPNIKTFYVNSPKIASKSDPGQFLMLWVIGVDEIPIAVSSTREDGTIGLTVEKVGDATSKLHELQKGDLIGIRGPYGRGFDLSSERLLFVGGGCGMAPLIFAIEKAVSREKDVDVIIGAETADELLFRSRVEKLGIDPLLATEDGSVGIKGLATDLLRDILKGNQFDCICSCGPELMLKEAFDLAEKHEIFFQASLERVVKCSVGLCDSCSIGPYRVCSDGPVFSTTELRKLRNEFGVFKRDASGKRTKLT